MCGRFIRKSSIDAIAQRFRIGQIDSKLKESYNVAPTQETLIIVHDTKRRLIESRWGFIPSWAKDPSIGYKMINARAETVAEKPSFRTALKKRRCLIVTDGFYEWKKEGGKKIPVFIRMKNKNPFCFAGLYSIWKSQDNEEVYTCTIITTEANELLKTVHHRMPVILPEETHDLWLDPHIQEKEQLLPLLKPYPAEEMEFYKVSTKVNSPSNDSATNIKPMSI